MAVDYKYCITFRHVGPFALSLDWLFESGKVKEVQILRLLKNFVSVSTESHVSVVYLKVTTKAVARSHVRDCDSGTVRNFLEDDRHGVGRVGPSIQVFIYITCLRKGKKILEEKGISLKHKLNPSLSFQAYGKEFSEKSKDLEETMFVFRTIGETTRSMTL
ncbi:hypothetical protein YC2023_117792 [Brassica napus]